MINGELKQMTELDKRLQRIAGKNWFEFVELIGEDAITFAKICLLRQNGNSYGQIRARLALKKHIVEYACGKCDLPNGVTPIKAPPSPPDLPISVSA